MTEPTRWDRRYAEHGWSTEPDPLLVTAAEGWPAGRALDLGCGTGRHAIWLAQRGWSVTGVDSSSVGLTQAAERARSLGVPLELVLHDLWDYQPPAVRFDLVLLAYVHSTPAERPALLATAASAVAPAGHLLVIGHHRDNLGRGGPPDPEWLYTPDRLRPDLPAGLALDTLARVERLSSDPDEPPQVAVVALLTRR